MLNRILSLIGWLGTAMVFVAVAIRFGYPAKEQWAYYLAWAGLVCVLLYTLGQWREIAKMFSGRQARYGTLAGVSVLVVLGILIAINYIGSRQSKRWDLTVNKQFSLSDQTRNVMAKLDQPMQLLVFAQEPDFQRYRDKLKEYQYYSKQVTVDYVDPDKKPAIATQNQVKQYGTIVISYKDRTERVTTDQEQDITNAIIKVTSGQTKKLYFTQGHGEKDTGSSERDGYNTLASGLGKDNYTAEKLVIAQTGAVPDDAGAVIIAGPKTDFLPTEIDALKKYLDDKSGKLLLEIDPQEQRDGPKMTNLLALAHDWGFEIGENVVIDGSGMGRLIGGDATVPVVASYPSHPITQRFNLMTAYPLTRSVAAASGGVNGRTPQPFAETSQRSVGVKGDVKTVITMLTASKGALEASQIDKSGPVPIAAAVSVASAAPAAPAKPGDSPDAPKPETRVAVIGDSDFATNAVLGVQGNRDFFMNTIGWLSQQESLISIRPKDAEDRRIAMTATQQANVNWLSLLVIPGGIFATGIYTWWRRR